MASNGEAQSNDAVSDKARGDAAARELLLKSYAGKLCPYLSISGLRQTGGGLVGATGGPIGGAPDGEAVSCQGPNCMKFIITHADKEGRATGGLCADAALPSAILQLRDTNIALFKDFTSNYRLKPRS